MKKPDPEMIDKENPEWTDAMFAKAKTASEVFPDLAPHSEKRDAARAALRRSRARLRSLCALKAARSRRTRPPAAVIRPAWPPCWKSTRNNFFETQKVPGPDASGAGPGTVFLSCDNYKSKTHP